MSQDFEIENRKGKLMLIKYNGNVSDVVIPDGVEVIGPDAFSGNTIITSVRIPSSVTRIQDRAFYGCKSLTSIKIPESVRVIEGDYSNTGGAIAECSNLANIEIMPGVEEIGPGAFRNCTSLARLSIPGSVRIIKGGYSDGVFGGCSNLISVDIQFGVCKIGDGMFSGCTALTEVNIPGSVRSIGKYSFAGCSGLTKLVFPEGVEEIGEYAFSGCDRLRSIVLPKRITTVSPDAFHTPPTEVCVYYTHDVTPGNQMEGFQGKYITLIDKKGLKLGKLYQLTSKVETHQEPIDVYVQFIRRLLGGKVSHLSEYDALFSTASDLVFKMCRAAICRLKYPFELTEEYRKMYINYLQNNADMILPSLIKSEDIESLSLLTSIDSVPVEKIDTYIEQASKTSLTEVVAILLNFKNKKIKDLYVPSLSLDIDTAPKEWVTQVNVDGTLTIIRFLGDAVNVTVPAEIDGQRVSSIAGRLGSLKVSVFFPHQENLRSVVIEEGIEVIAERVFLECCNLESIELPNSVKVIGRQAFYGCTNLELIVIPKGVVKINEQTFEQCTALSYIHIPSCVVEIHDYAFYGCEKLVIYAAKDSYAIKFAIEKTIKYVEL